MVSCEQVTTGGEGLKDCRCRERKSTEIDGAGGEKYLRVRRRGAWELRALVQWRLSEISLALVLGCAEEDIAPLTDRGSYSIEVRLHSATGGGKARGSTYHVKALLHTGRPKPEAIN